jgi:diguanylate cyclase
MCHKEVVTTLLSMLKLQVGMDLWMVTRISGDDVIVLQKSDSKYNVQDDIFSFSATLCHAMVNANGPNIASNIEECAPYKKAAMAQALPIGAYIGFPLKTASGELFGTLCAIDPKPQDRLLLRHKDFIETMAHTIEYLLMQEKALIDKQRMIDNYYYPLMSDSLTGVLNRRGWDDVLVKETLRAQQLADNIAVGFINISRLSERNDHPLSDAEENALKLAAMTLMRSIQSGDTIARIGESEFGVLLPDCNQDEITVFESLLRTRFKQQQISVAMDFTIHRQIDDLQNQLDMSRQQMHATSGSGNVALLS